MNIPKIMDGELPKFSTSNSARSYHVKRMESFIKYPSAQKAQALEELGYCVDWNMDDQIFDELQTKNIDR